MLVKIDKEEIDALKMVCALSSLKATFFNIETNPLMVQVEITEYNGDELSPKDAFLTGKSLAWSIATTKLSNL